MKRNCHIRIPLAALAGFALVSSASAAVTIDWVKVGDAGNPDDTTGYGGVAYDYQISKYEVTVGQYTEFLNAKASTSDTYGLYNTNMASNASIAGIQQTLFSGTYTYSVIGSANTPVTYVNWFDSARFCNWMTNGQGNGSTETGAYELNGATSGVSFSADANALYRLPTQDEWYKAAYYDPSASGPSDDYWLYPTQSDAAVSNDLPDAGNNANFIQAGSTTLGTTNKLTDVGTFATSESHYGTFDQGGNVWEWDDAVNGSSRQIRGGAWSSNGETQIQSASAPYVAPTSSFVDVGFRLAAIPEPSAAIAVILGGMVFVAKRRRSL